MGSNLGTARSEPRFTRHVRDIYPELEDLFAAGELVRQLERHPAWTHVIRLLHAEIAEIDRALDGGDEPLSQEKYALLHGRRGGLRGAEEALGELVRFSGLKLEQQRTRHEAAAEPVAGGR